MAETYTPPAKGDPTSEQKKRNKGTDEQTYKKDCALVAIVMILRSETAKALDAKKSVESVPIRKKTGITIPSSPRLPLDLPKNSILMSCRTDPSIGTTIFIPTKGRATRSDHKSRSDRRPRRAPVRQDNF
jgi:hypothetical protein